MDGILREGRLAETMRRMLRTLQDAYRHPVDIEFTVNLRGRGASDLPVNLLQCRPFQVQVEKAGQRAPAGRGEAARHRSWPPAGRSSARG